MTLDNAGAETRVFAAVELENSAPFDFEKRLRGDAGLILLNEVSDYLTTSEGPRRRKRKAKDEEARIRTLNVLLANFVALWLNRVDATRFLAVPFGRDAYVETGLSLVEMQRFRDVLSAGGYLTVAPGFRKVDAVELGKPFGRLTRIRPTELLIEWFERVGLHWPSLQRVAERGVVHIRKAAEDVGPEPEPVAISRPILERTNGRLEGASIALPDEAWARVRSKVNPTQEEDGDSYRAHAGDETAKVLRRIFSHSWERGGRIYGGWWMHLPKEERKHLTIDDEGVVELDYAQLHPTLLFLRVGRPPAFDPYALPAAAGGPLRDLGKRTFQRLINGTPKRRGPDAILRALPEDVMSLPPSLTFSTYLRRFKEQLAPVAQWFGTGEGMKLQREDSDLAIRILELMDEADILTLPIHDSFIVQKRKEPQLRDAMNRAFFEKYLINPELRAS